ncbi:MAG: hypothetical protein HOZ81_50230 [Streptomyces sp.]|nr:hypothetical protein [Streptomyces sp.]NUT24602.1 hypothetical protein [Streptomyces sp.]
MTKPETSGRTRRGTALAGLLTAAAAAVAAVRAIWFWGESDATREAVEHSARLADSARETVLTLQSVLNWGWAATAVLLAVLATLVWLASVGRWLLFGLSALFCLPLGIAGWRLPAAPGLDALSLVFCGCVIAASAVALLTAPREG